MSSTTNGDIPAEYVPSPLSYSNTEGNNGAVASVNPRAEGNQSIKSVNIPDSSPTMNTTTFGQIVSQVKFGKQTSEGGATFLSSVDSTLRSFFNGGGLSLMMVNRVLYVLLVALFISLCRFYYEWSSVSPSESSLQQERITFLEDESDFLYLKLSTLQDIQQLIVKQANFLQKKEDEKLRRVAAISEKHGEEIVDRLKVVAANRKSNTKANIDSWLDEVKRGMEKTPMGPRLAPLQQQAGYVGGVPVGCDDEIVAEAPDDLPGPAYAPPEDPWSSLPVDQQNEKRKLKVVDAFLHSWNGYKKYAWGKDELRPKCKSYKNWNEGSPQGMGLTILDSLSTLYLMGLTSELEKALNFVKHDLSFNLDVDASFFESTIRILGSLLSIYELTGENDKVILSKAVDIADRLVYAYNTSTGIPHSTVNLQTKRHFSAQWAGGAGVLSEFGTVQVEMRTLSFHTGNPIYDMKATHSMNIIESRCPRDGLCPVYMSIKHARWMTDHITIGALGDSYYEYLLKQYLLTGKTEPQYKRMFLRASRGLVDKLVYYSTPSKMAYVAEYRRQEFYHKMDHLACFAGGMLALGAHEVDLQYEEKLLSIAEQLTDTCVLMYTRQKSGVSPEFVEFPARNDFINGPGYYILRPETFEAILYMWRLSKKQKWRDVGWRLFRAIDRWCKVESGGYGGLKEVNVKKPLKDDLMQSFWMAETLKYVFLLFSEDSKLDFTQWIMNTEGHPLRIRKRDPLDIWRKYEEEHGGRVPWRPPKLDGVRETETEKMKEEREAGKDEDLRRVRKDPFGEDSEDGPIDDEGLPFDRQNGMKGIKRTGLHSLFGGATQQSYGLEHPPSHGRQDPPVSEKQTSSRNDEGQHHVGKNRVVTVPPINQQTAAPYVKKSAAVPTKPSQKQLQKKKQQVKFVSPEGVDENDEKYVETEPKRHHKASEDERRAALQRQKELRLQEKKRQGGDGAEES